MAATPALNQVAEPLSLYYSDAHNDKIQAQPVTYDTRFRQGFTTLSAGTSTFLIPVDGGLNKVLLVVGLSAAQLAGLGANDVIPRAWGYEAIESITYRVAGSSEYTVTAKQLLARNLRLTRDAYTRNQVYNLGGSQILGSAVPSADQFAYIPLPFFNMVDSAGLSPVVAGDLLAQQIQIRVTLKAPDSLIKTSVGPSGTLGSTYGSGVLQAEFLRMKDRHQSLANESNFEEKTYVHPLACNFDQTEIVLPVEAGGAPQTLTFAGIQFGQVLGFQLFLTSDDAADVANPTVFFIPKSVALSFAGTQYAVYENFSSRIWGIMDSTAQNAVNASIVSNNAGVWVSSSGLSEWVICPMSQPIASDHATEIMVDGMVLSNGSVQVAITPPDNKAYKAHLVPILRAGIAYSRGSANLLIG